MWGQDEANLRENVLGVFAELDTTTLRSSVDEDVIDIYEDPSRRPSALRTRQMTTRIVPFSPEGAVLNVSSPE
jgi:hypothetical protein